MTKPVKFSLSLFLLISALDLAFGQSNYAFMPQPRQTFVDANGVPLSGGKLHTWIAGTSTALATYHLDTLGNLTPNQNPIILDVNGSAEVRLLPQAYKMQLTDSNGVQIWQIDNIQGFGQVDAVSVTSLTAINTGTFANIQQDFVVSALGGINTQTWYSNYFAGNSSNGAITGLVKIPNGALTSQINAVSGSIQNDCTAQFGNSLGSGQCYGVPLFSLITNTRNGARSWGENTVCQDMVGISGTQCINEYDTNVFGSPILVEQFQSNGVGNGTMPPAIPVGSLSIINVAAWADIQTPFSRTGSGWTWPVGIVFRKGSINGTGLQLDGKCFTGACNSQDITATGYDSGNVAHTGRLYVDSNGNWNIPSSTLVAPSLTSQFINGVSALAYLPQAFSFLGTCNSALEGQTAAITNSTTATNGATITGGGTHHVLGYCNGTNWLVVVGT